MALAALFVAVSAQAGAPRGSFAHTPRTEARPSEPLAIEGNLSGSGFARVILRVRGSGEEYEDVTLELQYGDLYRVTLPAARLVAPGVEYYVEGQASSGERVPLFASAAKPVRVVVPLAPGTVATDERDPLGRKGKKGKKGKVEKDPEPEPRPEPKVPEKAVEKAPEKTAEKVPEKTVERAPEKVVEKAPERVPPEPEDPADGAKAESTKVEAGQGAAARGPEPRGDRARKEPRKGDDAGRDARGAGPKEGAPRRPPEKGPPGGAPPRPKSELDEELALYGAEDLGGQVQRLEARSLKSPLSPTVLTAEQLQRLGVRTVAEALDSVQGLTVSRDVQGNYRVAVRGVRADPELLVLLDGQRLNNAYDGKALLQFPIETLARVEVYRGPATADLGLGDVLGVINLVTNRDEGVRVSGTGGIYDAAEGHLSAGFRTGDLHLFLSGDVASQYGYKRAVTRDFLDPVAAPRTKFTRDKRLFLNAGGGATYSTDSVGQLELSGHFLLEDRVPLIGAFDAVGNDSRLQWNVFQAQASWKKPLGDSLKASARLWYDQQATNRLWQLTFDGYQARASDPATLFPDGMLEEVLAGTRGGGLDARIEVLLPAENRLIAGLAAEQRSLSSFDWLSNYEVGTNVYGGPALRRAFGVTYPTEDGLGGRGKAADRFSLGLFAQDTWTPSSLLTAQAGMRVDLVQLPVADAAGRWTSTGLTPGIGPRIGVLIAPIEALALRLHYGRSFRAPTIQELSEHPPNSDIDQGHFVGNPALKPAVVDSADASFEYLQGVGEAKVRLRASIFFERFSNPIVMLDTSGNLVPYANRPLGMQAYGLDGEARLEVSKRASAFVNAAWVRGEDLGTPAASRLLTDVPQARLNAGLTLPLGPFLNFDVLTHFQSERRNPSRSVLELIRRYSLPGVTTVAAQLRSEPIFDRVELIVTGQNVFNFEFSDDAVRPDRVTGGVPRESALVFGTLRVSL